METERKIPWLTAVVRPLAALALVALLLAEATGLAPRGGAQACLDVVSKLFAW